MVERMIPMRTSSIFKSRWMALIWAAGIIWLAVDVAGGSASTPSNSTANETGLTDQAGQPVTDEDAQKLAKALGL
jgi:hypothetical protein